MSHRFKQKYVFENNYIYFEDCLVGQRAIHLLYPPVMCIIPSFTIASTNLYLYMPLHAIQQTRIILISLDLFDLVSKFSGHFPTHNGILSVQSFHSFLTFTGPNFVRKEDKKQYRIKKYEIKAQISYLEGQGYKKNIRYAW